MIVYKRLILLFCFILLNVHGYYLMGVDKTRAEKQAWRITEVQLITVAAAGGAAGVGAGMLMHRHKIRKPLFTLSVPVLVFINFAGLRFLMKEE